MTQQKTKLASRLWHRDSSLWSQEKAEQEAIINRLGWLDAPEWMQQQLESLQSWVNTTLAASPYRRVVVLGMGGSSLAPEVLSRIAPPDPAFPSLSILDSTAPEMVQRILEDGIQDTLFIVASKSGTTLETADLYRFFYQRVAQYSSNPGDQFIAITDQDSWLQRHAAETGFRHTFINPSDIGGRYSALSYFGMVPAALTGLDVAQLLDHANTYVKATQDDIAEHNDALDLGIFLGQQALQGRDKMQLIISGQYLSLGIWIEQLVAESTGKQGKGIVPVCISADTPALQGEDVFSVRIGDQESQEIEPQKSNQKSWSIVDPMRIGAEFFKWEFATAIAAHLLDINPFDEPNVAEAKRSTNSFIKSGRLLQTQVVSDAAQFELHQVVDQNASTDRATADFFNKLQPGSYIGLLAYLPIDDTSINAMEKLRHKLIERYRVACTIGFGPRYLHSTGQLHKGGSANGLFIQFISESTTDFDVPETNYSFSQLLRAQADGDISVLASKGLPVMRVQLKGDRLASIAGFTDVI